jgi:hypothetical protein
VAGGEGTTGGEEQQEEQEQQDQREQQESACACSSKWQHASIFSNGAADVSSKIFFGSSESLKKIRRRFFLSRASR